MMNKTILFILWCLLSALPIHSQSDSELAEDSVAADSIAADTVMSMQKSLPWPLSVQSGMDSLLRDKMFSTSQVALMVYDLDADSAIYRHNERQLMRPASTMKLVTAIAALDKLGGSYQFKTELCYTGKIENNTLYGDIYCVGGFDPKFNSDDMRAFVESIHKMGVDTIRGRLVADVSMKDTTRLGEGWCWDDDNPTLSPLLVSRKDNFLQRFANQLRDAGIVLETTFATEMKPQTAYCICRRFHTIDQILMRMMKDSNNLYAESMFYQLAASSGNSYASASDARRVIAKLIRKVGKNPSNYTIADGSGLSLYNYVSAELEIALLRYAFHNNNIYIHLHPSLPEAGVDGTLKKRMRNSFTRGNVSAKTGTLSGISTLAGYCTAANGHRLAFVIFNQGLLNGRNGRNFQDRVCTLLCQP